MNLIGLQEMSREEMIGLLDGAEEFLDQRGRVYTPPGRRHKLRGKTLGLLFFEPSTRTQVSFELAIRRLGGELITVRDVGSSVQKGESAVDTCRTLEAMGLDGFVVRHQDRQLPDVLVDRLEVPIINAGNGSGEHPTQGLLDALTLRRHFQTGADLAGLKIAIVGDIVHSRVARSDAHAFARLGAEVRLVGPKTLLPAGETKKEWPGLITSDREEALQWADAVVVLRIQQERLHGTIVDRHEYAVEWGIDSVIAERYLRPDTVILHPGPVIRGVELSNAVVDSERSLILEQVTHGVALRQAVLQKYFGSP